jgi:hypothetical protein
LAPALDAALARPVGDLQAAAARLAADGRTGYAALLAALD